MRGKILPHLRQKCKGKKKIVHFFFEFFTKQSKNKEKLNNLFKKLAFFKYPTQKISKISLRAWLYLPKKYDIINRYYFVRT